jgi:hypothetical protein
LLFSTVALQAEPALNPGAESGRRARLFQVFCGYNKTEHAARWENESKKKGLWSDIMVVSIS